MSFQQGLSGLNATSQQLSVIGNNVANANTVGFKQSTSKFSDVYAASLNGGGATQIGIGTKLAKVSQEFTQGNITNTNNTLDVAINGNGFFIMSQNGVVTYTRNGQFEMDKDGYIVNSEGKRLRGNSADNLEGSSPVDIQINTSDLPPKTSTQVTGKLNLNSDSPVIDQSVKPFNPSDATTYTNSTSITVYDALGNSHTVQNYFVKTAANTWQTYTTADGSVVPPKANASDPYTATGTIKFTTSGAYDTANSTALNVSFTPSSGAAAVNLKLDYTASTQYGSGFSVNKLAQDGYTSGRIANFSIGSDGIIVGRYSNGQSQALGRVVLANFVNPNGLRSLGGNQWQSSFDSGEALIGAPGSSTLGVLQSSAVEDSNVDLTAELVNMIMAQRVYQANSQTIKTQDQVLQTLVNMR
ncbi:MULTISPECIES: flagellar hook protein FlgE [unclassified Methylophilus]|uniref:flagellar hook protein FlgE n=1 Tax=unclassified Methylophilus TaxID=2630143 RepID=UPI00188E79B6|nr:flagellar hook protein FlgE [Methylophilus sp. 13]MBF5038135.1 flagellar hook protein FlgE [Methylophilus sp. 13]BEV07898.1 flagellar hook protein FlgE [Methylophilus sp. DW102]